MPQISLYIDEPTLRQVEQAAKRQNLSLSKWVTQQLKKSIEPVYPDEYAALFGSITDATFSEPDDLNFYGDTKRENL